MTRSDLRRGLFSKVKTGEDGFVSDSNWSCSDGDRRDRSCQILTGRAVTETEGIEAVRF